MKRWLGYGAWSVFCLAFSLVILGCRQTVTTHVECSVGDSTTFDNTYEHYGTVENGTLKVSTPTGWRFITLPDDAICVVQVDYQ